MGRRRREEGGKRMEGEGFCIDLSSFHGPNDDGKYPPKLHESRKRRVRTLRVTNY